MLKFYCQGFEDIETIFLKELTCGYEMVFSVMMIVSHIILILHC